MRTEMMLNPEHLEHPFPTERLRSNGVLTPEVRNELAQIPDLRNALSVLSLWAFALLAFVIPARSEVWLLWPLAFILMTPVFARFAIMMHESAHRLLFSNRAANDFVGKWLIAYPVFVPMHLYRHSHLSHHREEFGPEEPDIAFYSGYPCELRDLRRRLTRDAIGVSGYKNLKPLLRGAFTGPRKRLAWSIIAVQLVIWSGAWAVSGVWYAYLILWLAPWMTGWRVSNRLRAIGEHGGLGASADRRLTTHSVKQSWIARLWITPYNTGFHLAHHVDMAMPWRSLPKFNAELEAAGYVNPEMTYLSYRALWRALCSQDTPIPARR